MSAAILVSGDCPECGDRVNMHWSITSPATLSCNNGHAVATICGPSIAETEKGITASMVFDRGCKDPWAPSLWPTGSHAYMVCAFDAFVMSPVVFFEIAYSAADALAMARCHANRVSVGSGGPGEHIRINTVEPWPLDLSRIPTPDVRGMAKNLLEVAEILDRLVEMS